MNGPRVAIIIDGPNLFYMIKYLGWNFNFWKLIHNITEQGRITSFLPDQRLFLGENAQVTIQKYYYDAKPVAPGDDNSFMKSIKALGFDLVPVRLKQYEHNGTNGHSAVNGLPDLKRYKSRTEYPIYIDFIRLLDANQFDILILFSGDSDFEFLLEECKKAGKRVIVFATVPNLSKELSNLAEIQIIESLIGSELVFKA